MSKHRAVFLATLFMALAVPVSALAEAASPRGQVGGHWELTGSLSHSRGDHTLTLLPSGQVLAVGGTQGGAEVRTSAEIWDPATGEWRLLDSALHQGRRNHSSVLLPSGKVLAFGGWSGGSGGAVVVQSELYDPIEETWALTDSLPTGRQQHTATLLASGKVLAVGGTISAPALPPNSSGVQASVEIYDPAEGWGEELPLIQARMGHTATLLPSGEVLVVGGWGTSPLASAEIFDPASQTWRMTAFSLAEARWGHTATLLSSGKVLVVGGRNESSSSLASAELFDPATETWTPTTPLFEARHNHTATLLASGEILIAGGGSLPLSSIELYDPMSESWLPAVSMVHGRDSHAAVILASGQVLVAGGWNGGGAMTSSEVFSPGSGTVISAGQLAERRSHAEAASLPSGKVLIAGGHFGEIHRTVEIYDPASGTWSGTGSLNLARYHHSTTALHTGEVLVAGGQGDPPDSELASTELYSPSTETWRAAGDLRMGRRDHAATLLSSGQVLVTGGNFGAMSAEIYDPTTETWQLTGAMLEGRSQHTATRLHSGRVLVVGGFLNVSTAELFDPATGAWAPAGRLHAGRGEHTATLLPSGKVLVSGGRSNGDPTASCELYDPGTRTWTVTGFLTRNRKGHTATLLQGGQVLVTGGVTANPVVAAELYDPSTGTWSSVETSLLNRIDHTAALLFTGDVLLAGNSLQAELYRAENSYLDRRPEIVSSDPTIAYEEGISLSLTGHFRGDSETGDGTTASAATNYPMIRLQAIADGGIHPLSPDQRSNFWDDPMDLTVSDLPPTLHPGPHLLTVTVAGVPSTPKLVEVVCSLEITQSPTDQTVPVGDAAELTVATQGGRNFQWQVSHDQSTFEDIPGATGPSYTTLPITAADSGAQYRVKVDSGCMSDVSQAATLTVADSQEPVAQVVSPAGGEYWTLSDGGAPGNTEIVTWEMSDNVRICRVEVSLLFSNDGGASYLPAPAGGGLPDGFGPGGTCPHPGEDTTSLGYTVPEEPPSGSPGSLYKVEVNVFDHIGLATVARSARPFFIVQPNPESVRTLILANLPRMQARMGLTGEQVEDLAAALRDLAAHPRVQGLVVDLDLPPALSDPESGLYAAWDEAPGDAARANAVLLAPGGAHQYLREELLPIYSGVENLLLVGDDRILPMARIEDGAVLFPENNYPAPANGDPADNDLTDDGTTVGQALSAGFYLSDDPLAMRHTVLPADLDTTVFIPDLAAGRLVESPEEIIHAIATFISTGGVLDLAALDPVDGHKVLVTGYDFLGDSAAVIHSRWLQACGQEGATLAPVDGELIGQGWDEADLLEHLCGNGGPPYALASVNGHATHYQEGIPGASPFDIQGLDTGELVDPDACGPGQPLDLSGGVVYAVGCHGGLPVADSGGPEDHPLDLPQALLGLGAQAYVANSGYGWGLQHGIGYSERLVEILTEEMLSAGTLSVGELVKRSKLRYYLEQPRLDPYDAKSLMQWSLFGFPMFTVTGAGETAASAAASDLFAGPPRRLEELPASEQLGGVRLRRRVLGTGASRAAPPSYLARVEHHFDFSASGLYSKRNAAGEVLPEEPPGCDDPEGCYYTFGGGLTIAETDLPLQPYTVFNSSLAGLSQHGVLWKGGVYQQEEGWRPVFAELASNGGDGSDHGVAPRQVIIRPTGQRWTEGGAPPGCRPSDLEVNSLLLPLGELLKAEASDPEYTIERIYREVDVEVFYYNNTLDGEGNCDREGPELGEGPFGGDYHHSSGATIEWEVSVSDDADGADGVWRVVVVHNDDTVNAESRGAWVPLELERDPGTDRWRGSVSLPGTSRLTYVLQAVDRRGNVTWLNWVVVDPDDEPSSGVRLDLPAAVDVPLTTAVADLAVTLSDAPDPAAAGQLLSYTISVENLGPDAASGVTVADTLPAGGVYQVAGGDGWSCGEAGGVATCTRNGIDSSVAAPPITLVVLTPLAAGTITNSVAVSAVEDDPEGSNDSASETTLVVAGSDLWVLKDVDQSFVIPGLPLTYTIAAGNLGPQAVVGATVSDDFPDLIDVEWSCVAAPGSRCSEPGGTGSLDTDIDLAVNGVVIFTAHGTVDPNAGGTIDNVATIAPPGGMGDPDPDNNSSLARVEVVSPADLIFVDGFESGDLEAWGATSLERVVVIELHDELPQDADAFLGRFVLDLLRLGLEESKTRLFLIYDAAGGPPLLALALSREGERFALLGRARLADGSLASTGLLELDAEEHRFELRWSRSEGGRESRALWVNGAPVPWIRGTADR